MFKIINNLWGSYRAARTRRNAVDLRQIRYFVALYEEQNTTKSAQRLNVVQPAVSMQIRRIEEEYGTQLFDRTPSGVFPNEIARSIYPDCIDILAKVGGLRDFLRHQTGDLTGVLSVGIPPSIVHGILPSVLSRFHDAHPQLQLAIYEGYSAHLKEWTLQGELDFAILSEIENDERLRAKAMFTEELRVVLSDHENTSGEEICGRQLQSFNLILPTARNLIRILIDAEMDNEGLALQPEIEIDSLSTVIALVERPGWATVLPASVLSRVGAESTLRSLRLVEPHIVRTMVSVSPKLKPPPAAASVFLEAISEAFDRRAGKMSGRITRHDPSHKN